MYKLKLDNVIKIVNSECEKEKLLKRGYILCENDEKIKKGVKKSGTTE